MNSTNANVNTDNEGSDVESKSKININQNSDFEIINLKEMAAELLSMYKTENKSLPKRIIYYRDDDKFNGELFAVHKQEVNSLRLAFKEVSREFTKPMITCVIICRKTKTILNNVNVCKF